MSSLSFSQVGAISLCNGFHWALVGFEHASSHFRLLWQSPRCAIPIQCRQPTVNGTDCFARLECELPETQDRFQDNASTWSDANAAIPSIEERLNSLERGMGEMIHLMRQMVNQSSTTGGSPHSHATRSVDEAASCDSVPVPSFTLKPVQFIRDLQMECFSRRDNFSSDVDLLGDVVSQGIIDVKLSLKLIELWVSL